MTEEEEIKLIYENTEKTIERIDEILKRMGYSPLNELLFRAYEKK